MAVTKNPGAIERFEQRVVFRVARGYFLFMAAAAVLVIAGGLIAIGLGVARRPAPPPPEPPPVPAAQPLTLEGVEQWVARQQAEQKERDAAEAAAGEIVQGAKRDGKAALEAQREELRALILKLQALFPAPAYSWDDVYETYCRVPTGYGCIETGRRLSRHGIFAGLRDAVDEVPGDELLPVLRVLVDLLGKAPLEKREALLGPTISALIELNARHRADVAEREKAIAEAKEKWEAEISELEASKAAHLAIGGYCAVGGLALLVLVSLFLAHFAIERHLRLLQRMVETLPREQGHGSGQAAVLELADGQ